MQNRGGSAGVVASFEEVPPNVSEASHATRRPVSGS